MPGVSSIVLRTPAQRQRQQQRQQLRRQRQRLWQQRLRKQRQVAGTEPWPLHKWVRARQMTASLFRRNAPLSCQVFSDIHLEMHTVLPRIPCTAPLLILAGDIGKLSHPLFAPFFEDVEARWHQVVYVPGNHEFHHSRRTLDALRALMEIWFAGRATALLDSSRMAYVDPTSGQEFALVGSTLWSRPDASVDTSQLRDFKAIRAVSVRGWNEPVSRQQFCNWHARCVGELLWMLVSTQAEGLPTVVITHFPPLQHMTFAPWHWRSPLRSYFATAELPVSAHTDASHVLAWVSGHTHFCYDFWHQGIRMVSNQVGYLGDCVGPFRMAGEFALAPARAVAALLR